MDDLSAESLLKELRAVDAERARRAADAELDARVQALKTYQQRRFAATYADLLANPRYEAATRFFLHELYGPDDYRQRDAQFARVIPTLTRLFPVEVVDTVARLARLHALSERLDTRMAEHLLSTDITANDYAIAWRICCWRPAQMAGLGALQNFLESGFDTFRAMRGAGEFLSTVRHREDTLARALFRADASALGQLP